MPSNYSPPPCPDCGGRLLKVMNPSGSMLNDEQFDAIRAGDWYCDECKGDRAKTGYRYFWNRELPERPKPPSELTTLRTRITELEAERDRLREAAKKVSAIIWRNGEWDEGCFYYEHRTAQDLGEANLILTAALDPKEEPHAGIE